MAKLYLIAVDSVEPIGVPTFKGLKGQMNGAMEILDLDDVLAKLTGADQTFDADPELTERCDQIDLARTVGELANILRAGA